MLSEDQLTERLRARLGKEVAGVSPRPGLVEDVLRRQPGPHGWLPGRGRASGTGVTGVHSPRRGPAVLAGAGLAMVAVCAAVAVALATVSGEGPAPAGSAVLTAAMVRQVASASRSALERSGRAGYITRELINGVLQGSLIGDYRFSGSNWDSSEYQFHTVAGKKPKLSYSSISRFVDGQWYESGRLHGRQVWIHDTRPVPGARYPQIAPVFLSPQIPRPRTLLSVLDPSARFQASGHQVIGGIRLKVLRAADPGRVTHLKALTELPGVNSYGEHVTSLQVWVDQHQVVHRMAITFSGPIHMLDPTKPVSKAAVEAYLQARRAVARLERQRDRYHAQAGKWPPRGPLLTASNREDQAYGRAYRILRKTLGYEFTVTFSAIGRPQHITAPRHALPDCVLLSPSEQHQAHCQAAAPHRPR